MKAQDYFNQYQTENQDQTPEWRFIHALRQLVLEIEDIAKRRNAERNSALVSIFKEQNLKARKLCKMLNELRPFNSEYNIKLNAFALFLQSEDPKLAALVFDADDYL